MSFLFPFTTLSHLTLRNIDLFLQSLRMHGVSAWGGTFFPMADSAEELLYSWCSAGLCWDTGLGLKIKIATSQWKTHFLFRWVNVGKKMLLMPLRSFLNWFLWNVAQWHKWHCDKKRRDCGGLWRLYQKLGPWHCNSPRASECTFLEFRQSWCQNIINNIVVAWFFFLAQHPTTKKHSKKEHMNRIIIFDAFS